MTPEMMNAARKCKSVEEVLAMAKENNITVSAEEAKKFLEQNQEGLIMDEELDNVSGGCGTSTPTPYNGPVCEYCNAGSGYTMTYQGVTDAYGNKQYKCGNCGQLFMSNKSV